MGTVHASLGMSLDGFVAGPNAGRNNPLGDGGMRIHRWVNDLEGWRERQSLQGGRPTPTTRSPRRRTPGPGPS